MAIPSCLMDVSIYIRDAPMRALPLLGGDKARHDWYNLLLDWNSLDYAGTFADIAYYGGMCACVCAVGGGLYFAYQTYRTTPAIVGWVKDDPDEEKRFEQFVATRTHSAHPPAPHASMPARRDNNLNNTFE